MSWWTWWSYPFFIKSWFDPPYGPFQNWSAICWISLSELQFCGRQQRLIDGATSVFTDSGGEKHSWRHLSIAVVAHKTVVQRVRSNRWRFNFEMAGTGGQINFLWKTAMIIQCTYCSNFHVVWSVRTRSNSNQSHSSTFFDLVNNLFRKRKSSNN